jgi:hypothetical protein
MEQNLGERERKIRLTIGLLLAPVAAYSYVGLQNIYLAIGLAFGSLGFTANYFTCFCGTKKAISAIKNKF